MKSKDSKQLFRVLVLTDSLGLPRDKPQFVSYDETYFSLFKLQETFIKPPDVLIYLRASVPTLVKQIQKRGRDYEESIRLDYLKRLNERYEAWISTYDQGKILVIDVDSNNFSENAEDLGKIIQAIDGELHGLFDGK